MNFIEFNKNRKIKQGVNSAFFFLLLTLGWLYFSSFGFIILACMSGGVAIAFLLSGRKWCDWYCPRGSFFDFVLEYVSPKKKIPAIFKNFAVRIIIIAAMLVIVFWQVYERYPEGYRSIGKFFLIPLTITTIAGILLGIFIHPRGWCYICPVGTFGNLISRIKSKLIISKEKCVICRACSKVCPMQIEPFKYLNTGEILDGDCLRCGKCKAVCSKNAIK